MFDSQETNDLRSRVHLLQQDDTSNYRFEGKFQNF